MNMRRTGGVGRFTVNAASARAPVFRRGADDDRIKAFSEHSERRNEISSESHLGPRPTIGRSWTSASWAMLPLKDRSECRNSAERRTRQDHRACVYDGNGRSGRVPHSSMGQERGCVLAPNRIRGRYWHGNSRNVRSTMMDRPIDANLPSHWISFDRYCRLFKCRSAVEYIPYLMDPVPLNSSPLRRDRGFGRFGATTKPAPSFLAYSRHAERIDRYVNMRTRTSRA